MVDFKPAMQTHQGSIHEVGVELGAQRDLALPEPLSSCEGPGYGLFVLPAQAAAWTGQTPRIWSWS